MRVKWIALCFLLGFIIVLDPSHTPAQFPQGGQGKQGGGKGGKGKNRDPFGGGGGGTYTFPAQGSGGFPAPGGGGNFGGGRGTFAPPAAPVTPAPTVTAYQAGGDQPVVRFAAPGGGMQPPMQYGGGAGFQFPGGAGGGGNVRMGGNGFPAGGGGFPGGGGGFQGGGPGGGGGGRGMGDPSAMWDRISRGQDSININDPANSWMKGMMERQGQTVPADGIITKQTFMAEAQKRIASMQGGSTPGGPIAVTLGSSGGGGSGMSFSMGPDGRMVLGNGGGGMSGMNFGGGGGGDRGLERLKEQDKDGDGRVSRAEADDRLKPNFDRIDRDGDGFITLEEYRAYYTAQNGGNNNRGNSGMDMASWSGGGDMGNWGGGNRQDMRKDTEEARPVAIRYGHLPKDLPEWFDSYDTNKDGQVALHEWLKAGKTDGVTMEEFTKYDLDGDQIITADEVLRFNRNYVEAQRIAAIENGTATGRPFAGGPGGGRGQGMRGPGGQTGGIMLPGASLDPANSSYGSGGKGGDRGPGGKGGERGPGGKGGERGSGGKGGDRIDRGSDPSADGNTTPPGSNGLWGNGGRKGKN